MFIFSLHVDVLMTYKSDILNSDLIVEYETNQVIESDGTLEQEFNKILIVRGGRIE